MDITCHDFSLKNTLECGQFFRQYADGNGYFVLAGGRVFRLEQSGAVLTVSSNSDSEAAVDLLGLNVGYEDIVQSISRDAFVSAAIRHSFGLRIMKQDPFECMVSYICSANSSVGKVRFCVDRISESFGKRISFAGRQFYGFPGRLSATEKELRKAGLGYRAAHLARTLEIISPSEVRRLKNRGYEAARETLLELHGIGNKVADCISLYALGFLEAFPVDRWIERVMVEQYLKSAANYRQISSFAAQYFGSNAGYAQQFLFNYRRKGL